MANNALIQGEAALRKTQGFVDYGAKLKPAMETARRANVQAKREKERKVEAIQAGMLTLFLRLVMRQILNMLTTLI